MSINLICPACSTKIAAPDKAVGKRAKCPKCTTRFEVSENRDKTRDTQAWLLSGAAVAIVVFCAVMFWLNN